MKKLLVNILIFSLPVFMAMAMVVAIDPYNYFPGLSPISMEEKERLIVDSHRNEAIYYGIWKTIAYKRNPVDRIIIGDSRPFKIDTQQIYSRTGEKYFNFAVPASNLDTAARIFWLAAGQVRLKQVYLGLGFHNYNGREANYMFDEIERCTASVFSYPLDSRALSATAKILVRTAGKKLATVAGNKSPARQGPAGKADAGHTDTASDQWKKTQYHLDQVALAGYTYPPHYFRTLSEISRYCRANGIDFHIIIYPQHQVIKEVIKKRSLQASYDKFIADMEQLATVHNFDTAAICYENRENFIDPIHPNGAFNRKILEAVWK